MGVEIIMHTTAKYAERLFRMEAKERKKKYYYDFILKFNEGEHITEDGKEPYSIIKNKD